MGLFGNIFGKKENKPQAKGEYEQLIKGIERFIEACKSGDADAPFTAGPEEIAHLEEALRNFVPKEEIVLPEADQLLHCISVGCHRFTMDGNNIPKPYVEAYLKILLFGRLLKKESIQGGSASLEHVPDYFELLYKDAADRYECDMQVAQMKRYLEQNPDPNPRAMDRLEQVHYRRNAMEEHLDKMQAILKQACPDFPIVERRVF